MTRILTMSSLLVLPLPLILTTTSKPCRVQTETSGQKRPSQSTLLLQGMTLGNWLTCHLVPKPLAVVGSSKSNGLLQEKWSATRLKSSPRATASVLELTTPRSLPLLVTWNFALWTFQLLSPMVTWMSTST
ncbi:hypothetical protein CPC08DRAFT_809256 [Agrocybe pediades]|nr:hypothetical protein CPC08DRAFT_809256 [Agrocybe pediades]